MTEIELREKLAEIIYLHSAGVDPKEFEEIIGIRQRLWKTNAIWDSQPNIELCEHERDEYRYQAQSVIKFLKELNLLNLNGYHEERK